jgi:hypothetical protein
MSNSLASISGTWSRITRNAASGLAINWSTALPISVNFLHLLSLSVFLSLLSECQASRILDSAALILFLRLPLRIS